MQCFFSLKISQMCCTQVCMHVTWMLICICTARTQHETMANHHGHCPMGPSIKYIALFMANFDPLPLSHFVTYPGTSPQKYVTHLGLPLIFSRPSTKARTKFPCTNCLSIVTTES